MVAVDGINQLVQAAAGQTISNLISRVCSYDMRGPNTDLRPQAA
jgi:hypothetical protein